MCPYTFEIEHHFIVREDLENYILEKLFQICIILNSIFGQLPLLWRHR